MVSHRRPSKRGFTDVTHEELYGTFQCKLCGLYRCNYEMQRIHAGLTDNDGHHVDGGAHLNGEWIKHGRVCPPCWEAWALRCISNVLSYQKLKGGRIIARKIRIMATRSKKGAPTSVHMHYMSWFRPVLETKISRGTYRYFRDDNARVWMLSPFDYEDHIGNRSYEATLTVCITNKY